MVLSVHITGSRVTLPACSARRAVLAPHTPAGFKPLLNRYDSLIPVYLCVLHMAQTWLLTAQAYNEYQDQYKQAARQEKPEASNASISWRGLCKG